MTLTVREEMRERERAKKWWEGLYPEDRWELGDQFVLGDFDWRDWFERKPTGAFLREVERQRILWEVEQ